MTTRMRSHLETVAWLLAVLTTSMTMLLTLGVRPTFAFEGSFCSEVVVGEYGVCESVTRSSIRRAIGHTKDAYTDIAIEAGGEYLGGDCRTIECEANTGYLEKDGTGNGYIENAGPNGSRKVNGYLYP